MSTRKVTVIAASSPSARLPPPGTSETISAKSRMIPMLRTALTTPKSTALSLLGHHDDREDDRGPGRNQTSRCDQAEERCLARPAVARRVGRTREAEDRDREDHRRADAG